MKREGNLWETCQGDLLLGSRRLALRTFTFFTRTSARFTMSGNSTSNVAKLPCFGEPKVRFGETYYIPCPSRRVPICLTGVVTGAGFEPALPAESLLMFTTIPLPPESYHLTNPPLRRIRVEIKTDLRSYCQSRYRELHF